MCEKLLHRVAGKARPVTLLANVCEKKVGWESPASAQYGFDCPLCLLIGKVTAVAEISLDDELASRRVFFHLDVVIGLDDYDIAVSKPAQHMTGSAAEVGGDCQFLAGVPYGESNRDRAVMRQLEGVNSQIRKFHFLQIEEAKETRLAASRIKWKSFGPLSLKPFHYLDMHINGDLVSV